MHRNLRISVVIPCYNEEDGVREVIGRMPAAVVDEIVVVDNNCTDRTAEVARSLGARVVAEKTPGYGAAYKAGLKAATSDVIVTLDGDGTYPPEEIARLVDELEDRRLDFLSASRFPLTDRAAMHLTNVLGNMVLPWLLGVIVAEVRDRLARREGLRALQARQAHGRRRERADAAWPAGARVIAL